MRQTSFCVDHRQWRSAYGLVLGVLCCLNLGCGAEKYQQRLAETSEYFAYQDRINTELGPVWSGKQISLRVPGQFDLVPPPAQPTTEDGEAYKPPAEDHRQPHYLGIELPGLVAAWKASVQADAEGGSEQSRTAYLYLFSNYDAYFQSADQSGSGIDPSLYLSELERQISSAIGVFLPEGDGGTGAQKNVRYIETIPGGLPDSKFRPPQDFTAVALSPEIPVSDVPLEMQLYEWMGSRMQVALLMVYPASVSPQEDLQERLRLTLQTFAATDQAPSNASSSGGGRPGPGGRF